ncbi:hypothetical protein NDR87_14170 [Nocardia sp. CDC159]|uniref:Uncharacterized protein n=1 Tax=Nocardia pulmonis TaxID=2951408 RepID=A0A9X2IY01_9NOCA|nr:MULTISPECIES: hypothetical protein [Nocardia]MCM6774430.1 hypothetical protein [Nocardia pulmonis]MCM6787504.1 hypothetical protein [Nocardia sp. CDC159]
MPAQASGRGPSGISAGTTSVMNIGDDRPRRCGELPTQLAQQLRAVQLLAKQESEMVREAQGPEQDLTVLRSMSNRLHEVRRVRELAEVAARTAGAASAWVDRVRRLGEMGREWDEDQMLPPPPVVQRRRSAVQVADDIKQVIDMAVLDVLRNHHLTCDVIEPRDASVITQYRTNMNVLLARARYTARLGGMTEHEANRTWEPSPRNWRQEVRHYLHNHSADDIDALWGSYASSEIERTVRRSLGRLHRQLHAADHPGQHLAPPPPTYLLQQARDALTAELDQSDGTHTTTAITTAFPEKSTHCWNNTTECTEPADTSYQQATEAGPDP